MSQLSEAPQAKENLEASKLTNPKDVGVDEGLNSLNEDPKEKFDDLVKDLKNLAWNTNNINYINMLWKKMSSHDQIIEMFKHEKIENY